LPYAVRKGVVHVSGRVAFSRRFAATAALGVGLVLSGGSASFAAAPEIKFSPPTCIATGANSVVKTQLKPENGWASVRAYFRAGGETDWYFMEMRATGNGGFFAVLPKPLGSTKAVDIQIHVRDADSLVTRGPIGTVKTAGSCPGTLSEEEKKYAANLVGGETVEKQHGKEIVGFECGGVVSRIDVQGAIRPDDVCRRAILVTSPLLIPALAVGAGGAAVIIIHNQEHKEISPSR
jgi:hypothetical protein